MKWLRRLLCKFGRHDWHYWNYKPYRSCWQCGIHQYPPYDRASTGDSSHG
jgi:hypothetical protein